MWFMAFEAYHQRWLADHPHRTEAWLRERLRDGFDIHHIDGDHQNNDPKNLVLIECQDHFRLHGNGRLCRVLVRKPGKRRCRTVVAPDGVELLVEFRERSAWVLREYAQIGYVLPHRKVPHANYPL